MASHRYTSTLARIAVTLPMVLFVLTASIAVGQEKAAEKPAVAKSESAKPAVMKPVAAKPATAADENKKVVKEFKGRLPSYYGEVIDGLQREKIYDIQKEYAPEIEKLKDQLVAIIKQRNAKVDAVLTAEQLARVEALRATAQAKREAERAAASAK